MEASEVVSLEIKQRFRLRHKRFIIDGLVVISSQTSRSQKMNINDCVEKLYDLLKEVKEPPKKRKATKPTKTSVKKRLEAKKKNSEKKKLRKSFF